MKSLPLILGLMICAACADIPELEGSELPTLRKAPYPELIPLSETLGPPADPLSEAAQVEEDLNARADALTERANALQNVEIN